MLGTKVPRQAGHDYPACGLAGGGAAGHPRSEAQGEGLQTNGHPRSRLINQAGREPGPRRPSPGHRLPGALGCTPSLEPSSVWARRPYTVSGGLSLVTQAWPVGGRGGGRAHGFLCPCWFTVTVPPLNTRDTRPESHRSRRGGQTQDAARPTAQWFVSSSLSLLLEPPPQQPGAALPCPQVC